MASIRKVKKQIKKLPTKLEKTEFGERKVTLQRWRVRKSGLQKETRKQLSPHDSYACTSVYWLLEYLEFRRKDAAFNNRIFRNERLRKKYANPFRKRLK